ncbi:MAG: hypothetical protein ACO1NO_08965 [Burkholderiaceae bacterium]
MSPIKTIIVVIAVAAYVAISHMALITPQPDNLWRQIAVAMLALPLVGIAGWSSYSLLPAKRQAARTLCALGTTGLFLYCALQLWPLMLTNLDWFYLAQHVVTNLIFAWFFGQTLIAPRTPLITQFAQTIHGPLPADIQRYTRGVTAAWTAFFLAQIALSLFIFYFFSLETWSLFANVLNWPLVILMFMGEYLCRRIMNPDFQHAGIKESINAYVNSKK